jgi:DNA-binding MarR family transcriptional regulator
MEARGQQATRDAQLDEIAEALPQRATSLARLFLARTSLTLSRTEIGVLRSATEAPQRVGDLAAGEGVTQPAISLVVNRLQQRGWVTRRPDQIDRRAVLVEATEAGCDALDQLRTEYRAFFHEEMATLDDEQVATLARAIDILDELIARLSGVDLPAVVATASEGGRR